MALVHVLRFALDNVGDGNPALWLAYATSRVPPKMLAPGKAISGDASSVTGGRSLEKSTMPWASFFRPTSAASELEMRLNQCSFVVRYWHCPCPENEAGHSPNG